MARNLFKRAATLLKHLDCRSTAGRAWTSGSTLPHVSTQLAVSSQLTRSPTLGLLSAAGGLAALGLAQHQYSPAVAFAEPAQQPQVPATPPQADDTAVYRRSKHRQGLPKEVILYQYEVCPFCNKVRAFLDYHKVPYRTVEVNPLTKSQLKWSEYKKVPVVLLDEEAINDSSVILSSLAVELEPVPPTRSQKGWFSKATAAAGQPDSAEAEAEEIKWRQWVDKHLVQLLTVNIYRTMRESWQTFDYITEHGNFSFVERQAARIAGSGLMYGISGRLIKKYGIQGDLRQALYAAAEDWMDAVGTDRTFMGGEKPNLADLSVFGVIRSVTGTDTFMDLMHKTSIGPWYERMMDVVGPSSRVSA